MQSFAVFFIVNMNMLLNSLNANDLRCFQAQVMWLYW